MFDISFRALHGPKIFGPGPPYEARARPESVALSPGLHDQAGARDYERVRFGTARETWSIHALRYYNKTTSSDNTLRTAFSDRALAQFTSKGRQMQNFSEKFLAGPTLLYTSLHNSFVHVMLQTPKYYTQL